MLLVAGNGFFKPNISTLVGKLYRPDDPRRDSGFTLFYMGINLGAFLGNIVTGYLAVRVGWHAGFGAAGIGMMLGLGVISRVSAVSALMSKRLVVTVRRAVARAARPGPEPRNPRRLPAPEHSASSLLIRGIAAGVPWLLWAAAVALPVRDLVALAVHGALPALDVVMPLALPARSSPRWAERF